MGSSLRDGSGESRAGASSKHIVSAGTGFAASRVVDLASYVNGNIRLSGDVAVSATIE
jgi:hypothetical protein